MCPENIESATKKIADARCLLLAEKPAYGFAALRVEWHVDSQRTKTACISISALEKNFHCYVNPEFIASMTKAEVAFVICHELEHLIRGHLIRDIDQFDHLELANIAADMTIHGFESHPKIGIRSREGQPQIPMRQKLVWVPDKWDENLTMEAYYKKLLKDKQNGWREFKMGQLLDDHESWTEQEIQGLGTGDQSIMRQMVDEFVKDIINSQGMGKCPGHWESCIKKTTESQLPWQKILKKYVSRAIKKTTKKAPSSLRRSRRYNWFGAPGHKPRISNSHRVAIVVDTSGSVSDDLLEHFFGEIDAITEHASLDVLLWDAEFQGFYSDYRARDWKNRVKMKGRGGTDMAAPVYWLRDNNIKANCYIILTDGFCLWPEEIETPVLGAIATPDYERYGHFRLPPHIKHVVMRV